MSPASKRKAGGMAALLCLGLAAVIVAIGLVFTIQLIDEYGASVRPLRLVAQAALLWLPPAGVLVFLAWLCGRYTRRPSA